MNTLFKRRYWIGRVNYQFTVAMRPANWLNFAKTNTVREALDYHCMCLMGGEL